MRMFFSTAVSVGLALFGIPGHAETTFDLSSDFSIQHNPNKVWQYGYSATEALDIHQFQLDKNADTSQVVEFWHPDVNKGPGPGYYPYIAHNGTKQTQIVFKGLAFRPGEVAMESSRAGQYGMIRFVAPATGTYKVSAQFEGIHFGLSTTDVHVLHNGTSLFDADIDGYGGDPASHAVQGASPKAEYSGQVAMTKDDTITFAIGYGKNKTNSCDTTGLFARVVLLGDSK
jgi:hypothetical protein